ncbi:MFS transporter [Ideonella sp. BN130291]|uniref:MFS transporter n=1 Tax=Ideonella sp. BN130291 TaxID=3112940 RepID=UPI002E273740
MLLAPARGGVTERKRQQLALRAFAAVSFAYFASVGLFNPYAPLWFKYLGFSTLAIGVLAALQAWTRVVAPYAWGWVADHSGRRTELLAVAAIFACVSSAGLLLARSYSWVALFVLLLFLANGGIVPLSEAALSHHLQTDKGMDAGRYGRVRVWGSLGFLASALLFGLLLQGLDIGVFPILVTTMLAGLVFAVLRLPGGAGDGPADAAGLPGSAIDVLRSARVRWFFAGVFLTVLAHTSLYAFFSLYLDHLGYGKAAVGLFWAVSVLAEIGFFLYQGRWFHRFSPEQWLLAAAGVTALRFAATAAFGSSAVVLVVSQLLHAITFAAQHAACIATVNRHFPGRLRGRGQALYTTLGYGLSGVLGGLAGGAISEHHGLRMVFWAAAGVALLATLSCWRAWRLEARAAAATPSSGA